MRKVKTIMLLVVLAMLALKSRAQAPGSSSVNPVVVSAGTQSLLNQKTDSTVKWYKFSLTKPTFYLRTIVKNQGHKYPLSMAELFTYDQSGNSLIYRKDSLLADTVILFSYEGLTLNDKIYLKLTFDSICSSCTDTTRFDFRVFEFDLAGCPASTTSCEYIKNGSFENTVITCSLLGINQPGSSYEACHWGHTPVCNINQGAAGTTDYFNSCAPNANYNLTYTSNGNPVTYNFYTTPHTGSAFAGLFLYAFDRNNDPYREYLAQPLVAALSTSLTYTFSMWVKASNVSDFSNGLEVILSNTTLCQNGTLPAGTTPGQQFTVTPSVINFTTWTNYTFTFTPTNNWNQVYIGNFGPNNTTSLVSNPNGAAPFWSLPSAYVYIDDVSITAPPPSVTATASLSSICFGQSSTLTATTPSPNIMTYTWSPSGTIGSSLVVSPSVTTVYTAAATNQTGCVTSGTVAVNVLSLPSITTVASPSSICYGNVSSTLTASAVGAGTYTWSPGGATTSSISVTPSVSTIYSIAVTGTNGCSASTTVAVNVYTVDPAFTVTPSDYFFCTSSTLTAGSITLNVSPASTYSVLYGSPPSATQFTNVIVLSPTATTAYTVQTYDAGCLTRTVVNITKVPCTCLSVNAPTVGGLITTPSTFENYQSKLKVVSDVTLSVSSPSCNSTNYQLGNTEYIVYPGVKVYLTGTTPATVAIMGCYFHGCGEMWEGLIVPTTGVLLDMQSYVTSPTSFTTNLVEDANVGVSITNQNPPTSGCSIPPYFLDVEETTFNKCNTGIMLANYQTTFSTNPYLIHNCLFTSRDLGVTPGTGTNIASWPNTNTVKNSSSGVTSSMKSPWISPSYSVVTISSTLYSLPSVYPQNGILLNNIGKTTNSGSIYTYYNITVGAAGTNSFNCFDNLCYDINAVNSNFEVVNSVFQNGNTYGKAGKLGGRGIAALSVDNIGITNRNHIRIGYAGSTPPSNNCQFYEKSACADITNYFSTLVEYANAYSYQNDYSKFNLPNYFGNRGFNIQTNRYQDITVSNNQLSNIKNAIMVGLNYFPLQVMVLWNYREIGALSVTTNTVQRYIGTIPTGSVPYVNVGVSIADPVVWGISTTYSPLNCVVTGNYMTDVHNGIYVANMSKAPVGIGTNSISMKKEPAVNSVQKGIAAVQNLFYTGITQNSVTIPSGTGLTDSLRNIWTNSNFSLSVRCNSVSFGGRGIEFNRNQPTAFLEDNQMKNHLKGLMLDNFSVLGPPTSALGSSVWPTNNVWNGSWGTGTWMAFTYSSSAQLGKMYIKKGGTGLDPLSANSSSTTGNMLFPTPDRYTYTTGVYANQSTLLGASGTTLGCRIGTGTGNGAPTMQRLLELAVKDSISYLGNITENQYMDKVFTYRAICSNTSDLVGSSSTPTFLSTWYTNTKRSIQDTMMKIEGCISNGAVDTARAMINAWTTANSIESTYKDFYNVYANIKDSTFTNTDSVTLVTIANSCPYVYGMSVYQARALYNIYYNGFYPFFNNCSWGSDARSMAPIEDRNEVRVQLSSEIYPNPNDGNYTLRINRNGEKTNVEICIFDIAGRLVLKELRTGGSSNEFQLKNNLQNGMYLVKVKFDDGTYDIHHLIISK